METWRILAGTGLGLAICLVGVALATNWRGVTEWHVRRSMAVAGGLRRVPPWRWLPAAAQDRRLARFVLLERVLGVAFTVAGVAALVVVAHSLLTGEPPPSKH
ncbi:hypothetical protein [Micromonospora auratinigra]|uniref:Uncharacterized protein n=1 Tax=Micromonospora auratinigra TaxID=261654 RepID=A0A1A9A0R3_9ACTN|nr:hypothetical protein [Micromonospora auratinigra]SBT50015.1 hypothetical protein GA0070611_4632 [Micromonospora auratinigra]